MSAFAGDAVKPGDVIAGKYQIERVVGAGGMGYVALARHLQFEDRVALKLLLPELAKNREIVERFVREGRAARKIRGEHVVEVSDVGQTEVGVPFMVMEYLDGRDLAEELRARGPLPIDETIDYVLQASEALVEAHAMGIVHRDLKPANLFLTRRRDGSPCVKVLDFGISKMTSTSGEALTRTSGMMGTVLYMSPEQLQSARDVDGRSDLWAMGCILYELLSGQTPFRADDLPQTCVQVMMAPTPSVRALRPEIPTGIEQVIARCLQKDRAQRFGGVASFARALAPFAPPRARLSLDRIAGVAAAHGGAPSEVPPALVERAERGTEDRLPRRRQARRRPTAPGRRLSPESRPRPLRAPRPVRLRRSPRRRRPPRPLPPPARRATRRPVQPGRPGRRALRPRSPRSPPRSPRPGPAPR